MHQLAEKSRMHYISGMNEKKGRTGKLAGQKFFIQTFGCQMNENDSERIAGLLTTEGAVPAANPEESGIIIINTCAVREKPVDKLYALLGRMKKLKQQTNPGSVIGVTGCVAQLKQNEIIQKMPFVDFILGPDNYWRLNELLSQNRQNKFVAYEWCKEWHEIDATARTSRISAFVTIMEGCNNFCSYCVVPYTRGREKFRPAANILKESKELAQAGYVEVQFLGQNVNSYRDPQSQADFSYLLAEAARIEGIEWIRFITSHPKDLSEEIAAVMQRETTICRQLHLPLQAGSNSVLKRMNRRYTREEYLEKIAMLRRYMPDISLSTDIIVGFPGETKKDFEATLQVLEIVRFTNIFSFRYSPRPRTAALKYPDDVTMEEKRARLIKLQSLQKEIQLKMNKELVGRSLKVLCLGRSKKDPLIYSGRNEAFQVVNFSSPKDVTGQFLQVHIDSCGPYSLRGKAVDLDVPV